MEFVKKTYHQIKGLAKNSFGKPFFVSGFFLVTFIIFSVVFFSDRIFSQAALPDCTASTVPSDLNTTYPPNKCNPVACSSLSPADAKNPDNDSGYNCYYAPLGVPLRPCKAFLGASAVTSPLPRENCADLIDLPLCSIFPSSEGFSGVNCVKEAKDISEANPTKVRGVDYAVHNKDSIRFCGQVEACGSGKNCNTTIMNSADNCTRKKCHQIADSDPAPNAGTNCNILQCIRLAVPELKVSDSRFDDESKKYCDGEATKCYQFFNNTVFNPNNSSNLQYLKYRINNPMCQIHSCRPDSGLCGVDDTKNILSKDSVYQADYIKYINAEMPIESGLCEPVACEPASFRQYRCLPLEDQLPTDLNTTECDKCIKCLSGEVCPAANECAVGTKQQECVAGYCNKFIDCNLPANSSEEECVLSDPEPDASIDLFDAWFYRPTPPNEVMSSNGLIRSDIANKIRNELIKSDTGEVIRSDFCYTPTEVRALGFGTTGPNDNLLNYWHTIYEGKRSPNLCNAPHRGRLAIGYKSLCGAEGIYGIPSQEAGFIKGVSANYELRDPEFKINACLRYENARTLSVCGTRECRFSISAPNKNMSDANASQNQFCGYDVCKELTIFESDIDRCSLTKHSDELFSGTDRDLPSCIAKNDKHGFVRMRARKYGRQICVFIDHKGALAYDPRNFNGTEKLSDGTCIEGVKDTDGTCKGGKNTNDEPGRANVWRTVSRIQYVGDNQPGDKNGYIDMDGRFFAAQDCVKIPLRLGPPRFYGVATVSNSRNLFEPPLFILNARTARGGEISAPAVGEKLGFTDFYNPEIVVKYGITEQKMSLGAGYIGDDSPPEEYPSSPWSKTIESSDGSTTSHSADIFITKEYNEDLSQPTLCLYRRMNNADGSPTDPIRISCVKRNKPEISDIFANMKVLINPDAGNLFNSAKLKLRLISDYGANNKNNNCSDDDVCSNEFIFENKDVASEKCNKDIEQYKICSKRDPCSELLYECANNEIALHNAIIAGTSTSQFDAIKRNCNTNLLPNCNRKLGIINSPALDFFGQIDISTSVISGIDPNYQNFQSILNSSTRAAIDPKYSNAYGWFNEMCIVKGFEDKLKQIIAYRTIDGIVGKCKVDASKSLYLNDNNPNTNCNAGGKAPYCVCAEYIKDMTLEADEELRTQTPREAGLCIDIPIPKFCQAIDYTSVSSSDVNDPNFARSSVANSIANNIFGPNYSDTNGVHQSHQLRTNKVDANHAEYNSILGGTNTVYGVCNGFWKAQINSSGDTLHPTLNCKIDGNWEVASQSNSCIRYTCPAITTSGIQEASPENNSYQNNYALGEIGDDRGKSNGFATWPSKQKTNDNDFLENVGSNSCIIGYELPKNASGNTLTPTRACNQLGGWGAVKNACVRKMCPAVAVGGLLPAQRSTQQEIETWNLYGGATFAAGKASRSDIFVPAESVVTGVCNNGVGFFSGGTLPTMECDSQGNWKNLQNPCVTLSCAAISGNEALSSNNGFANWPETQASIKDQQPVTAKASSCATGYFVNPYTGGTLPTRQCQPIFSNNEWFSKWDTDNPVTNPCINKCPGADMDSTIGRGITTEITSKGLINISWPSIEPVNGSITENSYAYSDNCINMDASYFTQGRNNGCYRLRRLCGNGTNGLAKGQWAPAAEPMCVANNGQIGGAKFSDSLSSTSGVADAVPINGATEFGTCVSPDYVAKGEVSPVRECVYESTTNRSIDKVYFQLKNQDCDKTCSIASGTSKGNAVYVGTKTTTKNPGESLNLSCKSGFAPAIGADGVRTSTPPSITCATDGSGVFSSVVNDCSAMRSCDASSPISGSVLGEAYMNCTGPRNDDSWRRSANFITDVQKWSDSNGNVKSFDRTVGGASGGNDAGKFGAAPLDPRGGDYCGRSPIGRRSGRATVTFKCVDGKKVRQP